MVSPALNTVLDAPKVPSQRADTVPPAAPPVAVPALPLLPTPDEPPVAALPPTLPSPPPAHAPLAHGGSSSKSEPHAASTQNNPIPACLSHLSGQRLATDDSPISSHLTFEEQEYPSNFIACSP